MDWQQVMARPDHTLAEKRAMYEVQCKRLGMKPYPEVHRKPKCRS